MKTAEQLGFSPRPSNRQLVMRYHSTGAMTKIKAAIRRLRLPVQAAWIDGAWEFTCPAKTNDAKLLALDGIIFGLIGFYGVD